MSLAMIFAEELASLLKRGAWGGTLSCGMNQRNFVQERYLGKAIDVKGQNFELLPFVSRRMCPGYSLGLKMIGTSLANLSHGFNWIPGEMTKEELSMEDLYGLTNSQENPSYCCHGA